MALAPGALPITPGSSQELVTVFESSDAFVIAMAKGALEDSGIPFLIRGDEIYHRQMMGPLLFSSCRFVVTRDREAEARELLQQLEAPIEPDDAPPPIPQ
jgi:hypothetical protein